MLRCVYCVLKFLKDWLIESGLDLWFDGSIGSSNKQTQTRKITDSEQCMYSCIIITWQNKNRIELDRCGHQIPTIPIQEFLKKTLWEKVEKVPYLWSCSYYYWRHWIIDYQSETMSRHAENASCRERWLLPLPWSFSQAAVASV